MVKRLRGDTGLTDLLDERDLPKSDLRFEVLGTVDEASSALGVVRASSAHPETRYLILEIQRDLCWMMSELAASNDRRYEMHITPERLDMLEEAYHELTAAYPLTAAFTIPGDTMVGALLHLARSTILRRLQNRGEQALVPGQERTRRPRRARPQSRLSADHTLGVDACGRRARDCGVGVDCGDRTRERDRVADLNLVYTTVCIDVDASG